MPVKLSSHSPFDLRADVTLVSILELSVFTGLSKAWVLLGVFDVSSRCRRRNLLEFV